MKTSRGLILPTMMLLLVSACADTNGIRPHSVIAPPAGKATLYFLIDRPSASHGGNCRYLKWLQLIVDNMTFAEMGAGSWTYLYVEPVPLWIGQQVRTHYSAMSYSIGCSYTRGSWGDVKTVLKIKPKPDQILVFELVDGQWQAKSEDRIHELLDSHLASCRGDCPGRDWDHSLQLVAPPEGHYISARFNMYKCLDKCYRRYDQDLERGSTVCPKECPAN